MLLYHPEVAGLSCDDCARWLVGSDWKVAQSRGRRWPRPPGSPTPCWKCPKCHGHPRPTPAEGRRAELSPRNWQTLQLFHRSRAGDPLPGADDVTRKNLGLVAELFAAHERAQRQALITLLQAKR